MLSQKDYDWFHATVHDRGFVSDDFEIGTVDYIDRMERLYPEFTRVVLIHKTTNVTARYVAGCGAYCLRMLERNLEKGVFNVI